MSETDRSRQSQDVLRGARTVLLETRRRDGTWVPTPVSLARDGGRLYFRTYDVAGKAKRLRNFPEVRVTPCTLLGKVKGAAVSATGSARLLEASEAAGARRLLGRQFPLLHGMAVPAAHRLKGWTTLHYELRLHS